MPEVRSCHSIALMPPATAAPVSPPMMPASTHRDTLCRSPSIENVWKPLTAFSQKLAGKQGNAYGGIQLSFVQTNPGTDID